MHNNSMVFIRKSCPGICYKTNVPYEYIHSSEVLNFLTQYITNYLIKALIASFSQGNIPFVCLAVFFQSEFLVRS